MTSTNPDPFAIRSAASANAEQLLQLKTSFADSQPAGVGSGQRYATLASAISAGETSIRVWEDTTVTGETITIPSDVINLDIIVPEGVTLTLTNTSIGGGQVFAFLSFIGDPSLTYLARESAVLGQLVIDIDSDFTGTGVFGTYGLTFQSMDVSVGSTLAGIFLGDTVVTDMVMRYSYYTHLNTSETLQIDASRFVADSCNLTASHSDLVTPWIFIDGRFDVSRTFFSGSGAYLLLEGSSGFADRSSFSAGQVEIQSERAEFCACSIFGSAVLTGVDVSGSRLLFSACSFSKGVVVSGNNNTFSACDINNALSTAVQADGDATIVQSCNIEGDLLFNGDNGSSLNNTELTSGVGSVTVAASADATRVIGNIVNAITDGGTNTVRLGNSPAP